MISKEVFNIDNSDPDFGVRFSGFHRCAPGHHYQARRDHFIVHVIISGKGRFKMAGKTRALGKGDAFFIFPETENDYTADLVDPWTYRYAAFSGIKSADIMRRTGITPDEPVLKFNNLKKIERLFAGLITCLQARKPGYEFEASSLLYQFLGLCVIERAKGWKQPKMKDKQDEHVKKAIDFVRLNYQRKISVAQLASLVGLERTYFSMLFHKRTHMSPLDLIIQTRITKAKELLKAREMRVSDVAYAVGYDDYFTFEKRFKKMTGKTPSDFIQEGG